MPKVNVSTDDLIIDVDKNYCLLDMDEDFDTSVIFGCKDATCGSCAVIVTDGADKLTEMQNEEKNLLENFEAPKGARLACQCRVLGDVTIKVHDLE